MTCTIVATPDVEIILRKMGTKDATRFAQLVKKTQEKSGITRRLKNHFVTPCRVYGVCISAIMS